MGALTSAYFIGTDDDIRPGWATDSPYVNIGPAGSAPQVTLFLGGAYPAPSLTDQAELAMRLIEVLQGIRADLLQRAADPHAAGDGATVPHRSIRTAAELRTHLVADHGAEDDLFELANATPVALEARHRVEHGQTYGVTVAGMAPVRGL